jgi:hypothetical protein
MFERLKGNILFNKLLQRPDISKAYAMVSETDSWYDTISTVHKSLEEIQRILGIKEKQEEHVIGRNDFEEEFSNLWGMFRGVTGIGTLLDGLGIKAGKSILVNYWKQDYKWEVITAIIVLMRMETSKTIKVETEFGIFRFKNSDCYGVLETLQNAGK